MGHRLSVDQRGPGDNFGRLAEVVWSRTTKDDAVIWGQTPATLIATSVATNNDFVEIEGNVWSDTRTVSRMFFQGATMSTIKAPNDGYEFLKAIFMRTGDVPFPVEDATVGFLMGTPIDQIVYGFSVKRTIFRRQGDVLLPMEEHLTISTNQTLVFNIVTDATKTPFDKKVIVRAAIYLRKRYPQVIHRKMPNLLYFL